VEQSRSVTALVAAGVALALGTGCAGGKFWKSRDAEWQVPEGVPGAPLLATSRSDGVVQAGATAPAPSPSPSPFARLTGKPDKAPKLPVVQMVTAWRNRVEYLPNPALEGSMGPGLAGQVFMFAAGPGMPPGTADGKLTVALYDVTPRPAGQPAHKPEGWEFTKETLANLRTTDERFGPCYALFLPWPTYSPDVTRVRIAARFDPEQGHSIYAEESTITIDTSAAGVIPITPFTPPPVAQPSGGFRQYGSEPPPSGPGPGLGVMTTSGPPPNVFPRPGTGPASHVIAPTAPGAPAPPGPAPPSPAAPLAPTSFGPLAPPAPTAAGGFAPDIPAIPADLPPLAIIAPASREPAPPQPVK
jgi:hypothetical protein